MRDKALIPWREVAAWGCQACGRCCVGYRVPLKMDEYVKVGNTYGPRVFEYGVGKAYLRNGADGRCVFQRPLMGRWICTIQGMKPTACRNFPFQIHHQPVYGRGDWSAYSYGEQTYYIYLDPDCAGVQLGHPTERFARQILPEILASSQGNLPKQRYTTSKFINWTPP